MKIHLLVCLICILVLISGCSQPASETKTVVIEGDTIMINHFAFEPQDLVIEAGSSVTWKHNDSVAHTIVSQEFESETLTRGDQFIFTYIEKGEYDYYCSIHPSMRGRIIVK